MPVSYIDHVTSTTGPHAFTFDYLETSHIGVLVNGSALAAAPTGFTIDTAAKTVTLAADPGTDANVRILRTTPGLTSSQQAMLVDFQDGSVLSEADLDKACKQLLFIAQESNDRTSSGAIGLDSTLTKFDAENKRITNLANSVDSSDAVTKSELENVVLANDGTSDIVPQSYRITVGTQGTLTNSNQDVQFTLSPAPNSTLKNTFIVEIGGVVQNPETDFTITVGPTTSFITLLGGGHQGANPVVETNGQLSTGNELIVLNFGRSRNVFNFPATGEAASNTETPLTLRGFDGGDAVGMLSVKDSNNIENAKVTAGGTIKAKQIEPFSNGTLAVNPSTITTTGTITAGGDVSVGSNASITKSSGDATFNNVTISAGSQSSSQAVPKSYVDANGGFVGSILTTPTNLDTITTPGLYRGATHGDNAGANIPIASTNTGFTLRVEPIGAENPATKVIQTFTSVGERFTRRYSGSGNWSSWDRLIDENNRINQMAAPNDTVDMGSQRLSNVADPTAAQDAVTKNHLDSTVGAFSKVIGINNQCLNTEVGSIEQLLMFNATPNVSGSFSDFGASFDNAVSANIVLVPVSGSSSSPQRFYGDNANDGTPLDANANALVKVPANSGPFTMSFQSKYDGGYFEVVFYKYTAATATSAQRTTIKRWDNDFKSTMFGTAYRDFEANVPNDTNDAFYGVSIRVTNNQHTDKIYESHLVISRGL